MTTITEKTRLDAAWIQRIAKRAKVRGETMLASTCAHALNGDEAAKRLLVAYLEGDGTWTLRPPAAWTHRWLAKKG